MHLGCDTLCSMIFVVYCSSAGGVTVVASVGIVVSSVLVVRVVLCSDL